MDNLKRKYEARLQELRSKLAELPQTSDFVDAHKMLRTQIEEVKKFLADLSIQ